MYKKKVPTINSLSHYIFTLLLTCSIVMNFFVPSAKATGSSQSILITSSTLGTYNPPVTGNYSPTKSERIELRIHNWSQPSSGVTDIANTNGIRFGFAASSYNGPLIISDYADQFTSGQGTDIYFTNTDMANRTDFTIRFQRNVINKQITVEVWNADGSNYVEHFLNFDTAASSYSSYGSFGSDSSVESLAYYRWYSTLVGLNTQPPIPSATPGDLGDWEFDGNTTDSSGNGLNATFSPTPSYTATPVYAPSASQGPIRTIKANSSDQLDGTRSYSLIANPTITYLWSEVSGPTQVTWSSTTSATPTISNLAFGSYVINLVVTDSSGQSTTSTLKYGAVNVDNNDVVIPVNSTVNDIFGPMIMWGASPWPYFDTQEKVMADFFGTLQSPNCNAAEATLLNSTSLPTYTCLTDYWDTAAQGTISVTANSTTVTGSGTAFLSTFCGGTNTAVDGNDIIVWYPIPNVPGTFGRYPITVSTCESNTSMTLSSAWPSFLGSPSSVSYAVMNNSEVGIWSGGSNNADYYDNVMAFYNMYYRSGIDDYLTYARTLADRWFSAPWTDQGYAYSLDGGISGSRELAPRLQGVSGLILRAADGRSDMWPGIRSIVQNDYGRVDYTPSDGQVNDVRENAYATAFQAELGLTDPSQSSTFTSNTQNALTLFWGPTRQSGGNWVNLSNGYASPWNGNDGLVNVVNGSTTVTCVPASGQSSCFTTAMFSGNDFWTTTANNPTVGDPISYAPTYVDGTHLTISPAYQGATATGRGWELNNLVGVGTQPFMLGVLGSAFRLSYLDTNDSRLPTWIGGIEQWLSTTGFNSSTRGLWYGRVFPDCEPNPAADGNCVGGDTEQTRYLSGEADNAISAAYELNPTSAIQSFGDNLYGAMFGGPTGGPDADSTFITDISDGGWAEQTEYAKDFGFFYGWGNGSAWPAARLMAPNNQGPANPTIAITAPTNSSTVSGTVSLTNQITVDPSTTVSKVELFIDGSSTASATSTTSPYTLSENTTQLSNGSHTFLEKITDGLGNTASASVSVTVSNNPMSVNPTSVSFGNQTVGTTSSVQTVVVTNNSNASANITSVSTANPFSASGISGTTPIGAGQSKTISVTYSPTQTGNATGTLTLNFDSGYSAISVPLTGTGVADTTPPSIPQNVTALATSPTSVTVSWNASTDNVSVYGYTVYRNGALIGTLSAPTTTLNDGGLSANTTYSYTVAAFDTASPPNVSAQSNPVTVTTPITADTTPPSVPQNVTATATSPTNVTVSWDASTDNIAVAGYKVYRGSTQIATVNAPTTTYSDSGLSANTSYAYTVAAFDTASPPNVSAQSNPANLTTPAYPIISNITVTNISATSATINWITDQSSTSQVAYGLTNSYGTTTTLNASLVTSHSVNVSGLSASTTYHFQVISTTNGNATTSSTDQTFTTITAADTTPPSVPQNVTATATSPTTVTVSWNASTDNIAVAGYKVYRGSTQIATVNAPATTYNDTGLTAGTTYSYTVAAFDTASPPNVSAQSNSAGITTPAYPIISNITITNITPTSATINWITDQSSTSQVKYGLTNSYGTTTTLNASLVTSHSVNLSGLTASTNYHFQVVSTTAANATTSSSDQTFSTIAAPDTTPPSVPQNVTATATSSTTVTVSWNASTDNVAVAGYKLYRGVTQIATVNAPATTYNDTGLTAGTTYSYTVAAFDTASPPNVSAQSNSASITTPAYPIISNITVTSIAATSATINWITDQSSTSQVKYGLTNSYGTTTTLNSAFVTSHTVTLTGLSASTNYHFQVISTTSGNATTSSSDQTFSTIAAPDTTPPSIPQNVTATGTSPTTITVSWNASTDNVAVAGYKVYRNSTQIGTVNAPAITYNDTGLTANTTYTYTIAAFDTASPPNVSAQSASVNGTTLIAPDTTSPSVPQNVIAATTSPTTTTITWNASTDNVAVAGYKVYRGSTQIGVVNAPATIYNDTGLTAGTTYTYTVAAFDTATPPNVSTQSNPTTITMPSYPLITYITATAITPTSASINWITNIAGSSQVLYGLTNTYGTSTTPNLALVTSHTVSLSGLTPNTTYHFQVISTTNGNATTASTDQTFATIIVPDTTPPSVPQNIIANASSPTSVVLTWSPSTDNVAVAGYTIYRNGSSVGTSTTPIYHDSGLSSNTQYSYTVSAYDTATPPNASAQSSTATVTTPVAPDITPPTVPTIISVTPNSSSSITVLWNASTDNVAVGSYTVYRNSTQVGVVVAPITTYIDTGLTPSTAYSYTVSASDIATPIPNTSAQSTAVSATTPAYIDVTPPSIPGGLTASVVNSNSIVLTWTASTDDVQVAGYDIYKNGSSTAFATSAFPTYTDTDVSPGATYSYTVSAFDAAGNTSSPSIAASATIPIISGGGGGGGGGIFTPPVESAPPVNTPTPTPNPEPTPTTPAPTTQSNGPTVKVVNEDGTLYLIKNGVSHGVTNPDVLLSYGLSTTDASTATSSDISIPAGPLLLPNNGALVKSSTDPTVYIISANQKYGFESLATFTSLGYSVNAILTIPAPQLQAVPAGPILNNGSSAHLAGTDIDLNGTIYYIGGDDGLYGYPSLDVFNSWHIPGDFSTVVPANSADALLPINGIVTPRIIE